MKTFAILTSLIFFTLPVLGHHSPLEEETPWLWYTTICVLSITVIAARTYAIRVKRRKLDNLQGHTE